jgi:Helix-turn-helix
MTDPHLFTASFHPPKPHISPELCGELADRSGLHRTYISGVERQARNPTLAVMGALATAFGISLAELVAA